MLFFCFWQGLLYNFYFLYACYIWNQCIWQIRKSLTVYTHFFIFEYKYLNNKKIYQNLSIDSSEELSDKLYHVRCIEEEVVSFFFFYKQKSRKRENQL